MELLQTLVQNLDDSFEIYFQPFFNGDQPDIIVVRPKYGILIIEVKDWSLDSYSIVDNEIFCPECGDGLMFSLYGENDFLCRKCKS